jgi:hypothetical protein
MNPRDMVITALLLGVFVFLAGCYGLLYCVGRLRTNPSIVNTAYTAYGLQVVVACAILLDSSLGPWWKLLIAASCVIYLPIPPLTWRYLENLHRSEEQHS